MLLRCFRDGISCRLITHSITERNTKYGAKHRDTEELKEASKRDEGIKIQREERQKKGSTKEEQVNNL